MQYKDLPNFSPYLNLINTVNGVVFIGFTGTTKVAFGGVAATNFTVLTPSLIQATVPTGANTGKVGVLTPNGSALSKQVFTVQ